MSQRDADKWVKMCKPVCSVIWVMQPSQYTVYEDIPVHYLLCEKDNAIHSEAQRVAIDRIKNGPNVGLVVETLDCAHSPYLSRVEDIAAFVIRAAGGDGT